MEIAIRSTEEADVTDHELSELLRLVYVNEGYTPDALAKTLFKPSSVRARGTLFIAHEKVNSEFCGMVIVVPPESKARVLAGNDECEMHLLAVKSKCRGQGLGRLLVETALAHAKKQNWKKMILWTQKEMANAQRLYESCGFRQTGEMKRNGIDFIIYEQHCT